MKPLLFPFFCLVLLLSPALPQSVEALDEITCDINKELPQVYPDQIRLSLHDEFTMVVMWNTNTSTDNSVVRYFRGDCFDEDNTWKIAFGSSFTYTGHNGSIHSVRLRQLLPDSTYCYSVGDPCRGFSEEYQFKTPQQKKIVFAALADTGTWGNVTSVLSNLAADDEVSLVLHPGDLSYAQEERVWDTFGHLVEPVARTRPYMIIPGNWDVKPFAVTAFLNRYTMPTVYPTTETKLSYYYSFNYSVVHFVMMSSYDPYDSTSEQYKWLEEDLRKANADRKTHPWIVISFHSPMYSSSVGHNGSDMKFREAIEGLLQRYKVDLALSGHDHGYERTFPVFNGHPTTTSMHRYINPPSTIHILAGTGGATSDDWLERPEWTAHRESTCGYTKVFASHSTLHVTYLRVDGSVGDDFLISKGPVPQQMPVYLIGFVALIVFVLFPYCAYSRLPQRIFQRMMGSNASTSTGSWENRLYKHV